MLFSKLRRRKHDIPTPPETDVEGPSEKRIANPSLVDEICESTCPACGHHVAVEFFAGGWHPLTTLAWPESAKQAQAMPKLPHHFVRCVDCGHVYNTDFDYANVPYSDKPNLMFNRGEIWSQHLDNTQRLIAGKLAPDATVVEIGCGEGELLNAIADAVPTARCVGFDPNTKISSGAFEKRAELFVPAIHMDELRPDMIISRHVFEHLLNPLGFIQQLAFACSWQTVATQLFIEVPCVDKVLSSGRTVDFFYEHNSHFTTQSLERMLSRCAAEVPLIETAYNGEVVYALATFLPRAEQTNNARQSLVFRDRAERALTRLRSEFAELAKSTRSVAIWGGTGKAAAFINQNGLDAKRFPMVVDSDENKVGTFVPGTGQRIESPEILKQRYVDAILIATQWRASDIVLEIQRRGIRCDRVLLEFDGRLVDYQRDAHPYRLDMEESPAEAPAQSAPRGRSRTTASPHVSIAGAGLPLVPNSDSPVS